MDPVGPQRLADGSRDLHGATQPRQPDSWWGAGTGQTVAEYIATSDDVVASAHDGRGHILVMERNSARLCQSLVELDDDRSPVETYPCDFADLDVYPLKKGWVAESKADGLPYRLFHGAATKLHATENPLYMPQDVRYPSGQPDDRVYRVKKTTISTGFTITIEGFDWDDLEGSPAWTSAPIEYGSGCAFIWHELTIASDGDVWLYINDNNKCHIVGEPADDDSTAYVYVYDGIEL